MAQLDYVFFSVVNGKFGNFSTGEHNKALQSHLKIPKILNQQLEFKISSCWLILHMVLKYLEQFIDSPGKIIMVKISSNVISLGLFVFQFAKYPHSNWEHG